MGTEDVAAVVARLTGIPLTKLLMGEREKLLHMEDVLRDRVVKTNTLYIGSYIISYRT